MESGGNRNQYWVLRSVTKDLNLALVYAIFKFYQTRTPMVGLPRGLGDKLDAHDHDYLKFLCIAPLQEEVPCKI